MRPVCAAVIGVLTLAGCGSSGDEETGAARTQPVATSTSATGELQATWRTGAVTVDDMVGTLRANELGRWASRFRRNSPIPDAPTALILELSKDGWDLYG